MSLEFLSPLPAPDRRAPAPVARSPMERQALAAGARFEARGGWNLAADYGSAASEADACRRSVGWADSSHLGKLELQAQPQDLARIVGEGTGEARLEPGLAARGEDAWWCPLTARRALVICQPADLGRLRSQLERRAAAVIGAAGVVDVSTVYSGITIAGPLARELIARFCALDLRAKATPVRGFCPGSVARTPGYVLREDEDRFLMLFGWALGQYMWTVVADAAGNLGGMPVGAATLESLPSPVESAPAEETPTEAASHA